MLTILFHGCLLTLFAAVIQLFVALPQAPSAPLPPGTDVKGGKSDTAAKPGCLEAESGFMLVTDTKCQHSPEGGDPAEGKPWGNETHFKGGAASPALPSVRGEALLQPGKAGQRWLPSLLNLFPFHGCVCLKVTGVSWVICLAEHHSGVQPTKAVRRNGLCERM